MTALTQVEGTMLVLARYEGQEVVIDLDGTQVVLQVTKVEGNKVRLGFHAPRSVLIHRREVWDKIMESEKSPGEGK